MTTEHKPDVVVDSFTRFRRQVTCVGIFLEGKLGPAHEMDDLEVDTIRPVVPENAHVL